MPTVSCLPRFARLTIFLILFLSSLPAAAQNRFTGRVVEVLRGDVLRVRLDTWEVNVRLHGVDCPTDPPELREKARQYVARRVQDTTVTVQVRGTGSRQTVYGEVFPRTGGSLNKEMIQVGLGTWARKYAPQRTDLGALEDAAHAAGRGIWGDPSGANVPLPPTASLQTRPTPKPKPSGAAIPKRRPTPSAVTQRVPVTRPSRRVITAIASPSPRAPNLAQTNPRDTLWERAEIVFAFAAAFALVLLQKASGWQARSLPFQIILSLFLGGAVTMLVPLPLLLLGHRFQLNNDTLVIAAAAPLLALCIGLAVTLCRREQMLKATTQRPISKAVPGFVRVTGETSAPQGVVYSNTGRIPALYLHEVTVRYEPQTDGHYDKAKKSLPHRWKEIYNETSTADFLLTDDSGAVTVKADGAEFHPLRVARFYNEVPVETFFNTPYSGDTRTEIYFIPAAANVTVWGRWYRSSSPLPSKSEERVGFDPVTNCFVVVEGTPARIYTRKATIGLIFIFVAVALLALIGYCLLTPSDLTVPSLNQR